MRCLLQVAWGVVGVGVGGGGGGGWGAFCELCPLLSVEGGGK